MTTTSEAPRGRDEVVPALVDAAAVLFAERGPEAVSVREIAAAAGVNHGLVHRHFGSKRALLGAVLDRLAARLAGDVERQSTDVVTSVEPGTDLDLYWRVLARAILDGEDPRALQTDFPAVRQIIERGRREFGWGEREARIAAAQGVALKLGWRLFEPFLLPAAGLEAEDPDILREELQVTLQRLAERL